MNNDLILFRKVWLRRCDIEHVIYLESKQTEKDNYQYTEFIPEIKSLKEIMNKQYFWELFEKTGNSHLFVDIIKNNQEKERQRRKNIYIGKVPVNNKLF
jgi:hypothetical protein